MYQSGEKLHTLSLKILIFSPIYYYNFIEVQKKKLKLQKLNPFETTTIKVNNF